MFVLLFSHYFVHGGFFDSDTHVLDNIDKIRHIPATIVQGRYDMVCPAETAWELHKVTIHHQQSCFVKLHISFLLVQVLCPVFHPTKVVCLATADV